MNAKVTGKDLTKEAPRGPKTRLGDYVILARTTDKCRALIAGNIGEYHFDCPLDNMLFGWKGIKGDDFKAAVEQGATDEEMVKWVNEHGDEKSPQEISQWRDEKMAENFSGNPEKREWFLSEIKKYNLDPEHDDAL